MWVLKHSLAHPSYVLCEETAGKEGSTRGYRKKEYRRKTVDVPVADLDHKITVLSPPQVARVSLAGFHTPLQTLSWCPCKINKYIESTEWKGNGKS